MSDVPEPAVSAKLKAWLFNAITESIPKALAAHASEHEEAPRKRPWKGDRSTAGK
ncbi:Hypothetical predicted protein, partial [Pelobates cultripes]